MSQRIITMLLVGFGCCSEVGAQQFWIDMRANVQDDDGNSIQMEHFMQPLISDSFYVSVMRSQPPPDGAVLIESASEASLASGRLHLRNSCAYPTLVQECSGRAHWKDLLSYDLTGLPSGPVMVDVYADLVGTYGASLGTRYTVIAESATTLAVIDRLRADAIYWHNPATTTDDPSGFTLLDSSGSWSTLGPSIFAGQVELEGGVVNTVHVEMLINGDSNQDVRASYTIGDAAGVAYTSASGAFLSDLDGDGIQNSVDNCLLQPNPDQRDTNGDGFGNRCDPDLNNSGLVNIADLQLLRVVFFGTDPDADFNGDGRVNIADLQIMRDFFLGPPGPSGIAP